jgi:hypothetical protein
MCYILWLLIVVIIIKNKTPVWFPKLWSTDDKKMCKTATRALAFSLIKYKTLWKQNTYNDIRRPSLIDVQNLHHHFVKDNWEWSAPVTGEWDKLIRHQYGHEVYIFWTSHTKRKSRTSRFFCTRCESEYVSIVPACVCSVLKEIMMGSGRNFTTWQPEAHSTFDVV